MGWMQDNHIKAVEHYVTNRLGEKARCARHFAHRMVQRLEPTARVKLLTEIDALIKSDMVDNLFVQGKEKIDVLCNNHIVVVMAKDCDQLVLVTTYPATKARLSALSAV